MREIKQNGTIIIGVGSAFLFIVIALIVSIIILTSAIVIVYTKIQKNKCDDSQM